MSDQPTTPAPADQQTDSARPGRPPVLDDEKRRVLLKLLNKGCSRRTAAIAVECSPATITQTAQRDPEFAKQLNHAESKLEKKLLGRLNKASKKERYWRATGWLLERKFPDEYARRTPDHFTGDQMVQFILTAVNAMEDAITADQYEQIMNNLDTIIRDSDFGRSSQLLPLDPSITKPPQPPNQPL